MFQRFEEKEREREIGENYNSVENRYTLIMDQSYI